MFLYDLRHSVVIFALFWRDKLPWSHATTSSMSVWWAQILSCDKTCVVRHWAPLWWNGKLKSFREGLIPVASVKGPTSLVAHFGKIQPTFFKCFVCNPCESTVCYLILTVLLICLKNQFLFGTEGKSIAFDPLLRVLPSLGDKLCDLNVSSQIHLKPLVKIIRLCWPGALFSSISNMA